MENYNIYIENMAVENRSWLIKPVQIDADSTTCDPDNTCDD